MHRDTLKEATQVKIAFDADEPFVIDVKRFSIPGLKFTATCPHCSHAQDYEPDYFSYPTANGVETVTQECGKSEGGCGEEYRFDVRIGVTVELLETDAEASADTEDEDSEEDDADEDGAE